MRVYFVRHGETDGNLARRHQHTDTPLNTKGHAQARRIAPHIAALKPTHIVTSPFVRTMETTRHIIEESGLDIIPSVSAHFEELIRPNQLSGVRFISLDTVRYLWDWLHEKELAEGESYPALRDRVLRARTFLETHPDDAVVVVVSHSVFINFFIEHHCNTQPLTLLRAFYRLLRIFAIKNASITAFEVAPYTHDSVCRWTKIT